MYKYEKHVLAQLVKIKTKKLPVKINYKRELELAESKNDVIFLFLLTAVIYDLECKDLDQYELSPVIVLSFSEYCMKDNESKMSYAQRVSENQEFSYIVMDVILKVLDNTDCKKLTHSQKNRMQLLYIVGKEIDYQTGSYYEEPLERVKQNMEVNFEGDLRRPIDSLKPFGVYNRLSSLEALTSFKKTFDRVDYVLDNIYRQTGIEAQYLTVPYIMDGIMSDDLIFYDPELILDFARRDFIIMYGNQKEYLESYLLIDKFLYKHVIRPENVFENYTDDLVFWHIERRSKKTYLKAGTITDLNHYIQPKYQTRGYDSTIEVVNFEDLVFECIATDKFKEGSRSPTPALDSVKNKRVKRSNFSSFLLVIALSILLNYAALSTKEITAKIHEVKEEIQYNIKGGFNEHE